MMKSYWPTPAALRNDPVVAERMNDLPKVVFGNGNVYLCYEPATAGGAK